MKTKFTFMFCLLSISFAFAQNNLSRNPVNLLTVNTPTLGAQEIFRFRPGAVTQLDLGTDFQFGALNNWFSLGRINAGTQSFYGLRFQESARGLVMGYTSANANPRIEWIGEGSTLGNLEFRSGNGFGGAGGPGINTLVATMTNLGNTVFGPSNPFGNTATSPRVGIVSTNTTGLFVNTVSGSGIGGLFRTDTGIGVQVRTNNALGVFVESGNQGMGINSFGGLGFNVSTTGSSGFVAGGTMDTSGSNQDNFGLYMKTFSGDNATGIQSFAFDANNNIGVKGTTFGSGSFEAGIFGETPNNNGNNWAGFFDGDVFGSGSGIFVGSDIKLKENIKVELDALEIINQLKPVNYDFKKVDGLNLSSEKQHGFIAQELAEVLPELTKDVNKPVFDREGKIVSDLSFKSVNYTGLISILTAGIQELHEEVKNLKEELSNYKAGDEVRSNLIQDSNLVNDYYMEQNVPNPFDSQTTIKYQLPNGVNQASITVFDLNGRFIRDYSINKNNGEIVINASEIGK
ncbi:MAG: tail fiber domain-containing protein, partial [Flavobacterium sp.]